jgi:hypothetical protein
MKNSRLARGELLPTNATTHLKPKITRPLLFKFNHPSMSSSGGDILGAIPGGKIRPPVLQVDIEEDFRAREEEKVR